MKKMVIGAMAVLVVGAGGGIIAVSTFNQLLGVNNQGVIAGYFGSGAQNHPNKGYRVVGGASVFHDGNFPGSVQTQVTGLNDGGVTVGFFSSMNNANQINDNVGFYAKDGRFHRVAFPATARLASADQVEARQRRPLGAAPTTPQGPVGRSSPLVTCGLEPSDGASRSTTGGSIGCWHNGGGRRRRRSTEVGTAHLGAWREPA